MALLDMLETLAAAYNKGIVTLHFVACVLGLTSIKELLDLSSYFGVELVGTDNITLDELQKLEKELDEWRSASIRVLE